MLKLVKPMMAVLVALMFAACSFSFGGTSLDMDKIQDEISSGIEEQTGVVIESVECPEEVDAEEGESFTCDVTAEDGTTAVVQVDQTDSDGNVTWEIVEN